MDNQQPGTNQFELRLRPSQEEILRYRRGKMGISAVPGSGKTWTLSLLAAQIIQRGELADDQEVLVVTLVNSAVDNFYQRVGDFVQKYSLIPNMGYRVRTLHGLAHDIVRERPGLVGLDEKFQIIDERQAEAIRDEIARSWLLNHSTAFADYLDPGLDDSKRLTIFDRWLPEAVKEIALTVIRSAKDQQLSPEKTRQLLDRLPVPLPLAEMGWEMYQDYQRALNYRGAVDFDDLIRLALLALDHDPDFLARLRWRWPFILEDEAQDSSRLQEQILSKLAGPTGNWVRVGDPNQAIYETFTTANPRYLREFINRDDVNKKDLPESGRSTLEIIGLANYLVNWCRTEYPIEEARGALISPPIIKPTPPGDPQPNPQAEPGQVRLIWKKYKAQDELIAIADSLARYLPAHQNATVAVLVPRNKRGFELIEELERRQIEYEDGLLSSSRQTRFSAANLENLLKYLAAPDSVAKLVRVYEIWRKTDALSKEDREQAQSISELIRKVGQVEDFLWPGPARDWMAELELNGVQPEILASLEVFRSLVRRWQDATLLPIDQLILTVAQDILSEPDDLALAHKLAGLLMGVRRANPGWQLGELAGELQIIARNERRFIGFSDLDSGFNPESYRGKAVISTIHKAKGLEWDRVYLMSVNNYDFPTGFEGERFISEKWFIRDHLNLEAETLAQFETLLSTDPYDWYEEGRASRQARLDYTRERLRLLYVGLTRAKRELILTWNTGRSGKQTAAIAFAALKNHLDQSQDELNHDEND